MPFESTVNSILWIWVAAAAVFVWTRPERGSDSDAPRRHLRSRLVASGVGGAWILGGWLFRVPIWRWLNAAPDCCLHPDLALWLAMITAPFVGAVVYLVTR